MQLMKLEQNDNAENEESSTDAVSRSADDVSTFILYYKLLYSYYTYLFTYRVENPLIRDL